MARVDDPLDDSAMNDTDPSGLCECGCGLPTRKIRWSSTRDGHVNGKRFRFIHGHNAKLHRVAPEVRLANRKAYAAMKAARDKANPVARRANALRSRAFQKADPDWSSFVARLCRYRITLDQFHAKYEAQDFLCGVCGDEMFGRHLHIDHDHRNNSFRGVLCGQCNVGLGSFRDDPARLAGAIRYLQT